MRTFCEEKLVRKIAEEDGRKVLYFGSLERKKEEEELHFYTGDWITLSERS